MSKEQQMTENIFYPTFGAITSIGIGAIFLEVVGALVLGVIGAIGGWLAKDYIIPFVKKKLKINDKSN